MKREYVNEYTKFITKNLLRVLLTDSINITTEWDNWVASRHIFEQYAGGLPFSAPAPSMLSFFLTILCHVLQSSSVLFDPCYWKLTTSGRTMVCVRVATHVLYVAWESTRAWHRHLRREGWHPFVCSSRFLNSIALVVWRTLIRSRWTHSSLYMGERRQWISSSYYRQLKACARNLCSSVCQWDNQA